MESTETYKEILETIEDGLLNPEMVQDNKVNFCHGKELYRVKMPSQEVLSYADNEKNKLYNKLIQESDQLTEEQIIKIFKEKRDINIEELKKQSKEIEKKLHDEYINLVKKRDEQKEKIEEIKIKIKKIRKEHEDIAFNIAKYLSSSIETQVKNKYMNILTSHCTEKYQKKENKGEWNKVWNSFEDYQKDDSKLPHLAIGFLTHLMIYTRG
ncbi:MAG: hypothetical protein ACTSWG_10410 [Candidatus Helarchaeota archaeon]